MKRNALGVLLGAVVAAGCGGGSSSDGNNGCPSSAGVTIAATGFSSKTACITAGGTFTLTNADTIEHDVEDVTSICTPLGTPSSPLRIAAGTNHPIVFTLPASCGFEDAAHLGDPAFAGSLTIGSGGSGSGYP